MGKKNLDPRSDHPQQFGQSSSAIAKSIFVGGDEASFSGPIPAARLQFIAGIFSG